MNNKDNYFNYIIQDGSKLTTWHPDFNKGNKETVRVQFKFIPNEILNYGIELIQVIRN